MSPAKRSAEDTVASTESQAPAAKRQKVECSVQDGIEMIRAAISTTELGVTWSASLRSLLLALTPSALEAEKDHRGANDETLLGMLAEIFAVEEARQKHVVEDAKKQVAAAGKKKTKAQEAVEETVNSLKEIMEEASDAWKELSGDAVAVREAEVKSLQGVQQLAIKQKEAALEVKRDCFEPVKLGSWTDSAELQKHLATISALFKQISKVGASADLSQMKKNPEDRGSFDKQVVEMWETDLDKHIASLEEQTVSLASSVEALQGDTSAMETEITLEVAESMLNRYTASSLADQRTSAVAVRRETLEALKKGVEDRGLKKHQAALKKVCNKIPDYKKLVPKLLSTVAKKPSDRADSDAEIIREAEEALDRHISSLQDQLQDAGYDESVGKTSASNLSNVKQFLDLVVKDRESKQKEIGKEKGTIEELRIACFDPLKSGEWVGAAVPKAMVKSLTKLLKVLGTEADQMKVLSAVLIKRPADRAGFDEMLVQQLDDTLSKRMADISARLGIVETDVMYAALREAAAAAEAAQDKLEEAREKQHSNLQDAIATESKRKNVEAALERKRDEVKDRIEKDLQAVAGHTAAETALEEFKRARGALAFHRGCDVLDEIEQDASPQCEQEQCGEDAE